MSTSVPKGVEDPRLAEAVPLKNRLPGRICSSQGVERPEDDQLSIPFEFLSCSSSAGPLRLANSSLSGTLSAPDPAVATAYGGVLPAELRGRKLSRLGGSLSKEECLLEAENVPPDA